MIHRLATACRRRILRSSLTRRRYRSRQAQRRDPVLSCRLDGESLETRSLLALTSPWMIDCPTPTQNQVQPLDVSGDGFVTALDALQVVNQLQKVRGCQGSPDGDNAFGFGDKRATLNLDVNRDGQVTPYDALLVVNHLQAQSKVVAAEPATEGEPGDVDVVQFAKDLNSAGAVLYTSPIGSETNVQLQQFGTAQAFLNVIPGTDAEGVRTAEAAELGIIVFPTWLFASGQRLVGSQSFETLADAAELDLPTLDTTSLLQPLAPVEVLGGSPLHLPLNGFNETQQPIVYTVTVDNTDIVPEVVEGRSLRIEVDQFGDMIFKLFDQQAPRVTERITTLADADFYDGLTFHRVIDSFVIQGGDPLGNGTGSSELPDFDDQYDFALQHNRTGVLSMAKASDDTNNSQFFITEGPQRHLDFNHSIFGQLVLGESVREAISGVEVNTLRGQPLTPVVMNSVEVFDDLQNGLLRLSAPEGYEGSGIVTVTATLGEQTVTQSFEVTVVADQRNGGPFLADIPDTFTIEADTSLQVDLVGLDVEGDPIRYEAVLVGDDASAQIEVNESTGELTLTPASGFAGMLEVNVRVAAADGSDTSDRYDLQRFTVDVVEQGTLAELILTLETDSGREPDDQVTRDAVTLRVEGVEPGVALQLLVDGEVFDEIVPETSQTRFADKQLTEGVHQVAVRHVSADGTVLAISTPLVISIDQTEPEPVTFEPPASVRVGMPVVIPYASTESDVTLELIVAPTGVELKREERQLVWTPTTDQLGLQQLTFALEDAAGNTFTQLFEIEVAQRSIDPTEIDIHDFVEQLVAQGARLYGADWHAATTEQRQMFDDAMAQLPYTDVTTRDRRLNAVASEHQIEVLPTWIFADGTRLEGVQPLETIAEKLALESLPPAAISIAELPSQSLLAGSPLHVTINGDSPAGEPLTYTATSDNDLVQVSVASSNRVLRLKIAGYGVMDFELFDDLVPEATQHLVDQVNLGAYDGMQWGAIHAGALSFGDPVNGALGTDDLRTLDDQFHADLQHNTAGILSFAKLADDGNHQQLEISNGARRLLDFHQTIIGKLIAGEAVRQALQSTLTDVGGQARFELRVESAEIVTPTEDRLVTLRAVEGSGGTATVTVAVTTATGASAQQSFQVNVTPDPFNAGPYLEVEDFEVSVSESQGTVVQLAAFDVEGDAFRYFARSLDSSVDFELDPATGVLVLPNATYETPVDLLVGVFPAVGGADQLDRYDRQWIRVPQPVLGDLTDDGQLDVADIDLLCAAIAGTADDEEEVVDRADLNRDDQLDHADLDYMLNDLLGVPNGDVNLDGIFDGSDFVVIFRINEFEDDALLNSMWSEGDWNCDGDFGTGDFVFVSGG